jgi:hypothetical protein
MRDIYESVMKELKRHGFWRPRYGRVRFKPSWITPSYGYWYPDLAGVEVTDRTSKAVAESL